MALPLVISYATVLLALSASVQAVPVSTCIYRIPHYLSVGQT
jgi:hypothetical protein